MYPTLSWTVLWCKPFKFCDFISLSWKRWGFFYFFFHFTFSRVIQCRLHRPRLHHRHLLLLLLHLVTASAALIALSSRETNSERDDLASSRDADERARLRVRAIKCLNKWRNDHYVPLCHLACHLYVDLCSIHSSSSRRSISFIGWTAHS